MPEAPVRKLAAILAADIVGYSSLIERDEAGTVARLKSDREELIDPTIAGHGGRIVRLAGDGALVEFPSVVEATQCAIDVQRGIPARNADRAEDQQIIFRIGVNLGDIIVEDDNLHGEGINVAARLESLCEPGGILLSEQAWHQVDGKIDAGLEFVQERTVKNIERPVRIWRVLLDQLPERSTSRPMRRRRRIPWNIAVPGGLAIAALAAALFWYQPWAPRVEPADVERMALPLSDKPSIAVLPFDNLSGDPEDQFLADGLSEDIITTLSRVPSLLVIARNSTFTYKGKPVKVQQVANELGVRYVLEGSVQRSGEQLRVTAQFIDATTSHHLWADRFDRKVEDIFALQDEIAHKILIELQVKLTSGEHARVASRGTKSLEAWLLRLQAVAEGSKYTKEGMLRAREIFSTATRTDPNYARAWGGIAWTHWFEARMGGWTDSREDAVKKGIEFAERGIEIDPQEPLVHITRNCSASFS